MKKFALNKLLILMVFSLIFTACGGDPEVINEEEVITTLRVTLTPQGGGTAITLQYQDLDGDGPNEPDVTISGNLTGGVTYNGSIEVLNETEITEEDITEEIREEDEEHQFFFSLAQELGTIEYNDEDGDGNPIGLNFTMSVNSPVNPPINGTLTITLRHEPNKTATGVRDGDITNAGGETDVSASFNLTVN